MALRSAQVFKKSVVSSVEAGGSPAAPTAPVVNNSAPFLPSRIARIFSGRRISTRWPVLLRLSTRKAPNSSSRRTAWRAAPMDRPKVRAKGHNRKLQAQLADHERMAQQIGIDGALLDAQAETRGEDIFKLHPEEFGVHFFGFHDLIQRWNGDAAAAEALTSVLSVLHLFFSFDCRLLADSGCTGTTEKEEKNTGNAEAGAEVTEGQTQTKSKTAASKKKPRTVSGRSFLRLNRTKSVMDSSRTELVVGFASGHGFSRAVSLANSIPPLGAEGFVL